MDDHRAVALVEHVFQPADGGDVEVVGRLVEQQDVGIGEQRLRQQHAQLPAGRDFAHRPGVLVRRDADAEQQFAGARLGRVAAVLGEAVLELGGVQVILLARLRVGVDGVLLLHARPHLAVAHQHHVEHAPVLVGELILAQVGHALVRVPGDVAGARLQLAGDDLHEGRLAAAVGPDQAVAKPFAEFDGNVLEEGLGPELHGDVGGDEHSKTSEVVDSKRRALYPTNAPASGRGNPERRRRLRRGPRAVSLRTCAGRQVPAGRPPSSPRPDRRPSRSTP